MGIVLPAIRPRRLRQRTTAEVAIIQSGHIFVLAERTKSVAQGRLGNPCASAASCTGISTTHPGMTCCVEDGGSKSRSSLRMISALSLNFIYADSEAVTMQHAMTAIKNASRPNEPRIAPRMAARM